MLGNIGHDTIIVADRGYETYNNIAHLEARGIKYVIRIRSNHGIADKFNLTIDAETDFTTDILLTRRLTNAFKSNPEKYRLIKQEFKKSWKGYDYGIINKLDEEEYIYQENKHKYFILTKKGIEEAEKLMQKYKIEKTIKAEN